MEEPSKKWPDSNFSGPKDLTGTLTCCSLPRVSVKRRSTNLTSLSLIVWNISFAVISFSSLHETRLLVFGVRGNEVERKLEDSRTNKKSPRPKNFRSGTSLSSGPDTSLYQMKSL